MAAAIVAIAIGGFALSMSAFGRFASSQAGPVRTAATLLASQTLRVAQNAWKYGSPGAVPSGTWQSSVPIAIPGARSTSAPVAITAAISNPGSGGAQISVTVSYTPDPGRHGDSGHVTLTGPLVVRAPLPGSTIAPAPLVAQPSGTP